MIREDHQKLLQIIHGAGRGLLIREVVRELLGPTYTTQSFNTIRDTMNLLQAGGYLMRTTMDRYQLTDLGLRYVNGKKGSKPVEHTSRYHTPPLKSNLGQFTPSMGNKVGRPKNMSDLSPREEDIMRHLEQPKTATELVELTGVTRKSLLTYISHLNKLCKIVKQRRCGKIFYQRRDAIGMPAPIVQPVDQQPAITETSTMNTDVATPAPESQTQSQTPQVTLENKLLVIYHANCLDGFGAAWAAWDVLGRWADYYPAQHNTEPPPVTGKHVIIVDFYYPQRLLDRMAEEADSILVIDHHQTGAEELRSYPQPGQRSWLPYFDTIIQHSMKTGQKQGARAIFDMEKSGCILTWDFFHPCEKAPVLMEAIQDRDLWRFEMPNTRELATFLFSLPYDFELWKGLMDTATGNEAAMISDGAAIIRKQNKDLDELIPQMMRLMDIGGHYVPVVNVPYTLASEAGHRLAVENPHLFGATYYDAHDGRIFSLRSTKTGMNVADIAKEYGGGGHATAAGFKVPRGHFLAIS